MLLNEAPGRFAVDEGVVGESLDRAAEGPGVAEGVPRGCRCGYSSWSSALKRRKAPCLDSPRQPPPGLLVADLLLEVGHVLALRVGRQWVDAGSAVGLTIGSDHNEL